MSPTTSGLPLGRQCYADLLCQQLFADLRMEVQLRYRRMDFYELNVVLEGFSFDLKDL